MSNATWRDFCDDVTSEAHRSQPYTQVNVGPDKASLIREYAARFARTGGPYTVLDELQADGHDVSWDEVRSLVEFG